MYAEDHPIDPNTQPTLGEQTDVLGGQLRDELRAVQDAAGQLGQGGLDAGGEQRVQDPCSSAPDELHVCFHCEGQLAYPLDWSEEGPRHWRIVLRCPECESLREGVFEQTVVERLDDELDRAAGVLLGDLRRMTHANMSEEAAFFIRALEADLIVPSDF
jgi:hypothetical protein